MSERDRDVYESRCKACANDDLCIRAAGGWAGPLSPWSGGERALLGMSDKTESTQEIVVWCTPYVEFGGRGGLSSGFVVADGGGEVAFMVESLGFQRYGLAR